MAFYGDGKHENDIEVRDEKPRRTRKRTKPVPANPNKRNLSELTESEAGRLVDIAIDNKSYFAKKDMVGTVMFWAKSFGHNADLFVNCFKKPVSVVRALEKMKFKL